MYFYIFNFFTCIMVILTFFHNYVYEYIHLLYLSFITLFIGLYLSFINPHKFIYKFGDKTYEFNGYNKLFIDIIHIAIFVFIYKKYNLYYSSHDNNNKLYISILLLLFYIFFINVEDIYKIKMEEFLTIFSILNIIYFIILFP